MRTTSVYLRCIRWGLATGAAVGGGSGAVIGLVASIGSGAPQVIPLAALVGAVYGVIVALVPTVLGGIVVVAFLARRHPEPASYEAVRHDLAIVFAGVVGALDLAVLAYWAALGGLHTAPVLVAVLAAVNAATAGMLVPARSSIARAWAGDPGEPVSVGPTPGLRATRLF